jgi:hypothetical protein
MLYFPCFFIIDQPTGSYADLLFVQPFVHILHQTDSKLFLKYSGENVQAIVLIGKKNGF